MRNVLRDRVCRTLVGCQPLYGGKAGTAQEPALTARKRGEAERWPKLTYVETAATNPRAEHGRRTPPPR
jgi:hypothetical protein